jgi:hypothetical protein
MIIMYNVWNIYKKRVAQFSKNRVSYYTKLYSYILYSSELVSSCNRLHSMHPTPAQPSNVLMGQTIIRDYYQILLSEIIRFWLWRITIIKSRAYLVLYIVHVIYDTHYHV